MILDKSSELYRQVDGVVAHPYNQHLTINLSYNILLQNKNEKKIAVAVACRCCCQKI